MMAPRVGETGRGAGRLDTVLLWAQRKIGLLTLAPAVAAGTALIVFSHTRTAALALVLGLLVAFGTAATSRAGRRGLALVAGALALALPFLPGIIDWAVRGQDSEPLQKLSGRTAASGIHSQPALRSTGVLARSRYREQEDSSSPWRRRHQRHGDRQQLAGQLLGDRRFGDRPRRHCRTGCIGLRPQNTRIRRQNVRRIPDDLCLGRVCQRERSL